MMIGKHTKIYVAGCAGLVGSAITRSLQSEGYSNLLLPSLSMLDLTSQAQVKAFFECERPSCVILVAGKVVGAMERHKSEAEILVQNLQITTNVIQNAYLSGCKKLINIGSIAVYPNQHTAPLTESQLTDNEITIGGGSYALSKLAGIKLCSYYRKQYGVQYSSVLPSNLYGINDNYQEGRAHVVPALIRRFYEAALHKTPAVKMFGNPHEKRDFLFADDLAAMCVRLLDLEETPESINVGTGVYTSILELALTLKRLTGYTGELVYEENANMHPAYCRYDLSTAYGCGWQAATSLEQGLEKTYQNFLKRYHAGEIS